MSACPWAAGPWHAAGVGEHDVARGPDLVPGAPADDLDADLAVALGALFPGLAGPRRVPRLRPRTRAFARGTVLQGHLHLGRFQGLRRREAPVGHKVRQRGDVADAVKVLDDFIVEKASIILVILVRTI